MCLPLIVRSPLHASRGASCDGLATWADLTPTILDLAGASYTEERFFGRSSRRIIDVPSPTDRSDEIYAAHAFHEITNYYPMRAGSTNRHKLICRIAWKLDYLSG